MSIAGAMSNALSGLGANARAAEVVSSNVANAMTEGYGARSLALSTRSLDGSGSGVRVEGVMRHVDEALIGDRRLADASVAYGDSLSSFLTDLESALGTPDKPGSLSARVAQFEASLIEAAAYPDSEAALSSTLAAAKGIASHLNSTSDMVQTARLEADREIAVQVETLNQGLKDVQVLNTKIREATMRGVDPSGMMDLRQQKIDEIASIVPMKQISRDGNQVALISTGGAILLDGKAAELSFSTVNLIVPEMTIASGALSGLQINGRSIETSGARSPIAGGSLAAQFEIRDEVAIQSQTRLDAVARDFVERFQDSSVDPTTAPGAAGLFTDAGAVFDAADELGLSSRLEVNTLVDPDQGGALWRIRDGLGAAVPGNVGDSSLINSLADALSNKRVPASGDFLGAARSAGGLTADLLTLVGSDRKAAQSELSFASAQQSSLKQMELSQGVDTDAEMQKLMLIEQAYAANAQVISAADEMLQAILQL
ncbi:flagellar hook-associated protein FlgK [Aliiroseovarius marinus]|uniref:flagellar hook-associated protein FlgK n=1 Tax=Aliiroseovarius marinus TaxID=2500159 RepID=UPI003D7C438A